MLCPFSQTSSVWNTLTLTPAHKEISSHGSGTWLLRGACVGGW